jgi:hypothetical protein
MMVLTKYMYCACHAGIFAAALGELFIAALGGKAFRFKPLSNALMNSGCWRSRNLLLARPELNGNFLGCRYAQTDCRQLENEWCAG